MDFEERRENADDVARRETSDIGRMVSEIDREVRAEHEVKSSENLRDTIRGGFEAVKARDAEREDFERSRDVRRDVEARAGAKSHQALGSYMAFDQAARRDPRRAAERLAEKYATEPANAAIRPKPVQHGSKFLDDPSNQKRFEREADTGRGEKTSVRASVFNALRAAALKRADDAEYRESAPVRKAFKQATGGQLTYSQALERLQQHDKALRDDPLAAANRIAQSYGMPVTAAQEQRVAAYPHVERGVASMAHELPGLDHIADDVAGELEAMTAAGKRSRDMFADLRRAYSNVCGRMHAQQAQRKAMPKGDSPAMADLMRKMAPKPTAHDSVRAVLAAYGRL